MTGATKVHHQLHTITITLTFQDRLKKRHYKELVFAFSTHRITQKSILKRRITQHLVVLRLSGTTNNYPDSYNDKRITLEK